MYREFLARMWFSNELPPSMHKNLGLILLWKAKNYGWEHTLIGNQVSCQRRKHEHAKEGKEKRRGMRRWLHQDTRQGSWAFVDTEVRYDVHQNRKSQSQKPQLWCSLDFYFSFAFEWGLSTVRCAVQSSLLARTRKHEVPGIELGVQDKHPSCHRKTRC